MKNQYFNSVCCNTDFSICTSTTTFFEMDNVLGEVENFVDDDKIYAQQSVATTCKSPCPSTREMCITMCA